MNKKFCTFLFLFLLLFSNLVALSPVYKDGKYTCRYKTYKREYILCLPDNYSNMSTEEKNKIPLILMLHGAGNTAESFMEQTKFHEMACSVGYAVVYITGTTKKNSPGSLIGWHYFNDIQSRDDVNFLIVLLKYLQQKYELSNTAFAAGYSNGAFMVTKLASQYSKYFTAVASVAGMMPEPVWEKKASQIDVGFLQINGTKDEVVPMKANGTDATNPNPAMEDVIEYFTHANSAEGENKVKWILLEDGHHSWPTKEFSSIDCNKEILKFFDDFFDIDNKKLPVIPSEPEQLSIFREAYPDIVFESEYEEENSDWKITVTNRNKKYTFYWNNGSMIPPEELKNKDKYWTLLYGYDYLKPLRDPATYTDEEIAQIKEYTSTENRKNGAGSPMFFFDAVYDSYTQGSLEKHIKRIKFLGFGVNVHERTAAPLAVIDKRIKEAAKTDEEVSNFLKNINRNEGYYWRLIANTNRKSFHSLGIALDIQPKSYRWKEVFWSWAKDKNPDTWMLTKISERWMPPQAVIEIFEEEGFIWGGKWTIWDNMHFEYHPELIIQAKREAAGDESQ